MSDNQDILVSNEGGVMTVTLNRPDRLNTLTWPMVAQLEELVSEANRDPGVKVFVLAGAGRGFCAGHDLSAMGDGDELSDKWKDNPIWWEPEQVGARMLDDSQIFVSLFRMNKPTMAVMRGPAAGSGLALATACDLRIVSETAFFKTSYANAGRCGEPGSAYLLQRLVGPAKAREFMLLDEKIDASTALAYGLANKVFPDDALDAEAAKIAAKFAAGPGMSYAGIKRNLNAAERLSFEDTVSTEAMQNARASMSHDGKEAGLAFMEKRAPAFRGY
ncbi:MAG: enoyl-CoA hydratase/isomerase family protein [Novosphingobium sp.]|nr:enoyl-CoA hydratase/isomerase family protein [Novosphingobium sp.]